MKSNDISERLLEFAVRVIKAVAALNNSMVGNHVFKQLIRSSTSAGANYEEACGAESIADFVHKLQIVLKELRESSYWLRLIKKAELIPNQNIDPLIQENRELINIIAKSVVTAKRNAR